MKYHKILPMIHCQEIEFVTLPVVYLFLTIMVGKIRISTNLKTLLLLLDPAPQALLALQILLDYPDPFLHPPTKRDLDMYTVNSFTYS